jgi:hypothetical protein
MTAIGMALFLQNREHIKSDMDLSDAELRRRAEADRRELDPPIEVEAATWSPGGQLDWWVKERQEWWGRVRGQDGHQRWIRAVDLRRAKSKCGL